MSSINARLSWPSRQLIERTLNYRIVTIMNLSFELCGTFHEKR